MEIEGKDFMDWLHEVRKKMREEEKKSGLSNVEWMRRVAQEAEEIIGKKISKHEMGRKIVKSPFSFVRSLFS